MTPTGAARTQERGPEQSDGPLTGRNYAADNPELHGSRWRDKLAAAQTVYKAFFSPLLHTAGIVTGNCRFQPSCSEYATLALAQHGAARGLWLTVGRLLRCHPFARGGWDPVPFAARAQPEIAPVVTIEKPHPTNDPV